MEKDEYLKHSIDSDNNPIDDMVFDDPNPEEAEKEDGIDVYKKVLVDLASKISNLTPLQTNKIIAQQMMRSMIMQYDHWLTVSNRAVLISN